MRQSLGTAVFAGMLGVTAFGLLFTPAFYTVAHKIGRRKARSGPEAFAQADDVIADHAGRAAGARLRSRAI
jgi:hypothetical protein